MTTDKKDIGEYIDWYSTAITQGLESVDKLQLEKAVELIQDALKYRDTIYVCGNGGSAAISDHFLCDHSKCIYCDTDKRPKIVSLPSSVATITAIANDINYESIFSYQLEMFADPNDVLITISSSGNSPNIIKALEYGKAQGMRTLAFVGFNGGRAKEIADVTLHVDVNNYGVVEDCHQALMHILAQHIRINQLNKDKITL